MQLQAKIYDEAGLTAAAEADDPEAADTASDDDDAVSENAES